MKNTLAGENFMLKFPLLRCFCQFYELILLKIYKKFIWKKVAYGSFWLYLNILCFFPHSLESCCGSMDREQFMRIECRWFNSQQKKTFLHIFLIFLFHLRTNPIYMSKLAYYSADDLCVRTFSLYCTCEELCEKKSIFGASLYGRYQKLLTYRPQNLFSS